MSHGKPAEWVFTVLVSVGHLICGSFALETTTKKTLPALTLAVKSVKKNASKKSFSFFADHQQLFGAGL